MIMETYVGIRTANNQSDLAYFPRNHTHFWMDFYFKTNHILFTLEPVDDEEPWVEFSLEDNVSDRIVELPGVCGFQ